MRATSSRAHDAHHDALRLWLRLLTCTTLIEREVRRRLRERFGMTLARFDLMAQLERAPRGTAHGRAVAPADGHRRQRDRPRGAARREGLVERVPVPQDRRAQTVRLTRAGRAAFDAMAAEHERWIVELTAGLDAADRRRLHALLGELKASVRARGPTGRGGER